MWVEDDSGDLVNLDTCRTIEKHPVEKEPGVVEEPPQPDFCLMAIWENEESCWLTSGTEAQCDFRLTELKRILSLRP